MKGRELVSAIRKEKVGKEWQLEGKGRGREKKKKKVWRFALSPLVLPHPKALH